MDVVRGGAEEGHVHVHVHPLASRFQSCVNLAGGAAEPGSGDLDLWSKS